jgi:hypothetical protein
MGADGAQTVETFLAGLEPERREVVTAVRRVILDALPAGYEETVRWGMLTYELPLSAYPDTYNGQPLMCAALASQKKHIALYLMAVYQNESRAARLREGYARAGRKLDMGKSCVRFRRLEDVPLDVIGALIADVPPPVFVAEYEQARR